MTDTQIVKFAPSLLEKYGANLVEEIAAKADEYSALEFDPKNYDASAKILRTVVSTRTGIEARRKELKADVLEQGRAIDGAAKYLTALVLPIEEQLQAKRDLVDKERERIKTEKREAEEAARRAEVEARLKAEREAEEARLRAEREAEEKRLAEERARLEAEQAEQRRLAAEQEAAAKAERDRLAAERAAFEAEQRKAEAEQAAKERAAQEEIDRKRREVEAEARRVAEASAAAEQLERDRLDRIERDRIAEEKRAAAAIAEARRIERERVETEEARVAHLEQMAALKKREEALRPDREKLAMYAAAIRAVKMPDISDDKAHDFLVSARRELEEVLLKLENYSE